MSTDPEMVYEIRKCYDLDPIYSKHETEWLNNHIIRFDDRSSTLDDFTDEVQ